MALDLGHQGAVAVMGRVGQEQHQGLGQSILQAMSKQGANISIDQILQWYIEGRVFHAQQGNANTRLAWTEVTYDEDQPQFALRVPTGRIVIPLSLAITVEIQAGTFTYFTWSTTTNDIGNGTSTDLTITPMRRDAPHSSACVARSLYTANATAATGLIEVKRWVDPFVLAAGSRSQRDWDIRKDAVIPILVGPATLQMHTHATSSDAEGYLEAVWAEFETPVLVDL